MRLFIAIGIPEEIKEYLFSLQKKLPQKEASVVLARDFHLTLKFLGSVTEDQKKEIEKILKTFPFEKFTVQLEKVGVFPFWGKPRVIYVSVKVPEWLFEMQKKLENELVPLGFEKENRFTPHLTLARVKEAKHPKQFQEEVLRIPVISKTFPVEKFFLFESHLSPKGASYEKLASFPQ